VARHFFLSVAAAQLAAISERRIDRLVNPPISGLPAFLAANQPDDAILTKALVSISW
jgi:histidine ammonia-lyase